MLAVVEHDEYVAVAEEVDERGVEGQVLALLDVERGGDGLDRSGLVVRDGQLDDARRETAACRVHRREPQREARLPDAAGTDERHEAIGLEEVANRVDVVVTADELGRVGRGCGRAGTTVMGRRPLVEQQRRIVGEDARFELPRRGREIEPELVAEERPELVGLPERLALTAGAVQGHHELAPEALAQRVVDDEALELAHDRTGFAERQPCFEQGLDRDQPQLVELHRVATRPVEVRELAERGSPPQRQGGPEQIDDVRRYRRRGRLAHEPGESRGVDAVGRGLQEVAGRASEDLDLGRERLAQPGDVALDGGDRRLGRNVAPERVGEPVDRHHGLAVGQQHPERDPRLRTTDGDHRPAPPDLERPEHPHEQFHAWTIVPVLASRCKSACKPDAARPQGGALTMGSVSPGEQRRTKCRSCR